MFWQPDHKHVTVTVDGVLFSLFIVTLYRSEHFATSLFIRPVWLAGCQFDQLNWPISCGVRYPLWGSQINRTVPVSHVEPWMSSINGDPCSTDTSQPVDTRRTTDWLIFLNDWFTDWPTHWQTVWPEQNKLCIKTGNSAILLCFLTIIKLLFCLRSLLLVLFVSQFSPNTGIQWEGRECVEFGERVGIIAYSNHSSVIHIGDSGNIIFLVTALNFCCILTHLCFSSGSVSQCSCFYPFPAPLQCICSYLSSYVLPWSRCSVTLAKQAVLHSGSDWESQL